MLQSIKLNYLYLDRKRKNKKQNKTKKNVTKALRMCPWAFMQIPHSYFMYNANLSKTSKIKPSRSPDNPFFVFFRGGEGGGVDGDNQICVHWVLRP